MPTIIGRKKQPLSIEKLRETLKGSYSGAVLEYEDGVARIGNLVRQYWVDVRPIIGTDIVSMDEVSKRLRKQIPGGMSSFGADCC